MPAQAKFVALINEDKKDDAMVKFMFSPPNVPVYTTPAHNSETLPRCRL